MRTMRLHLLEHDAWDFSRTNITRWAAAKGCTLASTDVFSRVPPLPSLDDFDWLMVMGGSQHAWEEDVNPWLVPEKDFIAAALEAGKIVLGICLGAQLVAEALGGTLYSNGEPEIGWHAVTLTEAGSRSFLFEGVPETFTTFHWHSDHFSLPPGCGRLAQSPATPNQAYIKPGAPVVGIQFHPEYTRRMVVDSATEFGHEWTQSRYVPGRDAIIAQTENVPDTYWLMERLLDNIEREFG